MKKELEEQRVQKIKELGYMCYNMTLDKKNLPDSIIENVLEISDEILKNNGYNKNIENDIEKKIINIGYKCYNLYVDKTIGIDSLSKLCGEIELLNSQIKELPDVYGSNDAITQDMDDFSSQKTGKGDDVPYSENISHSDNGDNLKIDVPYGMEVIPYPYKKCKCGYRNKSYANYCGKCGTKLEGVRVRT